jgi:hypothetical protein
VSQPGAEWLLIRYRGRGGREESLGIALYFSGTEDLYLNFRDDLAFVDVEDYEIIAGCSKSLRAIALDLGGEATFRWMSESLSNTIFVEGPYQIDTKDPEQTSAELFNDHCQPA